LPNTPSRTRDDTRDLRTPIRRHSDNREKVLTSHVETPGVLLHIRRAARARLRILPDPVLCLRVLWVAVFTLAFELIARLAFVPRDRVREAALESAFLADDVRIEILGIVVQLSTVAFWAETPAEARIGGQQLQHA
jgi:hypothetical protein